MLGLIRRHVDATVATFDARTVTLAAGRSLLALATLSIVAVTPSSALFVRTPEVPGGARCDGVRGAALWCVGGAGSAAPRMIAIAVLVAVAVGWAPRWTCVPHFYVTWSLGVTMTAPNGGDAVARVVAMLLIPVCLADPRRWQWRRPGPPVADVWRGRSFAAHVVLRGQASVIYGYAALSKLGQPGWRDGTFLHVVMHDPRYGLPGWLGAAAGVLDRGPVVAAMTWGTILVELAIAVAVWGPPRARRGALVAGAVLHGMIALLIGVVSFSLTMIALLLLVAGRRRRTSPGTAAEIIAPRSLEAVPDAARTPAAAPA